MQFIVHDQLILPGDMIESKIFSFLSYTLIKLAKIFCYSCGNSQIKLSVLVYFLGIITAK